MFIWLRLDDVKPIITREYLCIELLYETLIVNMSVQEKVWSSKLAFLQA
jgi:hypothetical protein